MKRVIVGSNNPVKLEATREAFGVMFPLEIFEFLCYGAQSLVPDQPFGSDETRQGATNRSNECKKQFPDADFFVGLEGGVEEIEGDLWEFGWMCVQDAQGTYGYGRSSTFKLPLKISALVREGKEVGHAADIVFNDSNIKQKGGVILKLTQGAVGRKDFYREAIIFALVPFRNSDLY